MLSKYTATAVSAALLAANAALADEATQIVGCLPESVVTKTVLVTPVASSTSAPTSAGMSVSLGVGNSGVKTVTVTQVATTTKTVYVLPTPKTSSSSSSSSSKFSSSTTTTVSKMTTTTTTTTLQSTLSTSTKSSSSSSIKTSSSSSAKTTSTKTSSSTSSAVSPTGTTGYNNAVYFTNWGIYGANYQPQDLPAANLTHVLYSFANINSDGTVVSSDTYADLEKHYSTDSWNDQGNNAYGCVKQLYLQKKKNRHMKLMLSIGGWTYSPRFAPAVSSATGRQTFCSSALTLVKDWGFDGIDIDWEYPTSTQETQYYVDLVKECRTQFDAYAKEYANGYHFQITVASPAGPANIARLNVTGMDPYIDAWHLMAYDYAGSWDTTSGHQANVHMSKTNPTATKFSTDTAVNLYLKQGISARKVIMGFPLYGRSFMDTDGPGEPYTGLGAGTFEAGIWEYTGLPRSGAKEYFDESILATWSYDNNTKEMVTYDNVRSAKAKTEWMLDQGLGGAVYWEASGDKNGTGSLVATVAAEMGELDTTENLLSYPDSVYDNIRNNME